MKCGPTVNSKKRRRIVDLVSKAVKWYGVPLTGYIAHIRDLTGGDGFLYQVDFSREDGAQIAVTRIYADEEGRILQYGTQSGVLTL